jgi:hypothetical protein
MLERGKLSGASQLDNTFSIVQKPFFKTYSSYGKKFAGKAISA